MKVYSLLAREGEPRYLSMLRGNYWFSQRGYEVVPFSRDDVSAGALDEDLKHDPERTLVFASVGVARAALARAGRPAPPYLEFPAELSSFFGRRIWQTTMGEVRSWRDDTQSRLPVHVKPRDRPKLFTGLVVESSRDFLALSGVPSDEPVVVQSVISIRSEWRATILRGKILNVAHYKGDPLAFPDPAVLSRALDLITDPPIGYAMDWAVTKSGETLLVEVNDGFALGNYGVPGHQYTALIECRWRQLMGLEDNGVGYLF